VITVGGTNGKGSCVAMLDSILSRAGYRVGVFTSPHLVRYNERIRIAGQDVLDAALVAAFERIEDARGEISLTFFEFNTLAALLVFAAADLDAIVLEVGLGGRLDAVNVVDADVAIVSSVALDHCEWLGNDVESIGREKAGIFRVGRPAIFGARAMPSSVRAVAEQIGAQLQRLGAEFDFRIEESSWSWRDCDMEYTYLPFPALHGGIQLDNASAVIAALRALRNRLSIERDAIAEGLRSVSLPARFQVLKRRDARFLGRGPCEWIVDVAHNPAAAATLAGNLAGRTCAGRTLAVCGMFADKDVAGVMSSMCSQVDGWIVAGIEGGRGLAPAALGRAIAAAGGEILDAMPNVQSAIARAEEMAQPNDRIVVFGSFHTAGPALESLMSAGWF